MGVSHILKDTVGYVERAEKIFRKLKCSLTC